MTITSSQQHSPALPTSSPRATSATLPLGSYQRIEIVTARVAVERLEAWRER
jgi:hypothetical protein